VTPCRKRRNILLGKIKPAEYIIVDEGQNLDFQSHTKTTVKTRKKVYDWGGNPFNLLPLILLS
jgi:hypothetical protein